MVNTTRPEIKETKAQVLPPADLSALKTMRDEMCLGSKEFKLQNQQRFLRRVLSPESPVRNLLMVHGTGTGKTCTAIQVAEEFIIRPEFQTKRVLVLANPSIQDNFKKEIFNVEPGKLDQTLTGDIMSKQCTGRRYLEIIQRIQAEPLRLTDVDSRKNIRRMAEKIYNEFYEFRGYDSFANYVEEQKRNRTTNDFNSWLHDEFDNRLIIVDEAHNLRVKDIDITTETTAGKLSASALEQIIKTADGVTLVLLTATPMYDNFDEIIYYFNLFLWNDRRIDKSKTLLTNEIFNEDGSFKQGQEDRFRKFCNDYVSYIKGDNPFTFPFRLPPPDNLIATTDRTVDHFGNKIEKQRKYLPLVKSVLSPFQELAVKKIPRIEATIDPNLICSLPEYKPFNEIFENVGEQYGYRKDVEKFLAPSKLATYSSKFALIMNILNKSKGIVYVYSNLVELGANLFALCLEEHGYNNVLGQNLLNNPSTEVPKGSKGKYVLFTGQTSDADIKNTLIRLKAKDNVDGNDIRVIVGTRKVAEGVDFKFVRQIHVLDPWFNMSRIEQVLGRGMRTCSHADLPFEQQNCTVYLHVCRYAQSKQETIDELIYRRDVEGKGARIAKVKRVIMESAIDCDLQESINNLPKDWRELKIPQTRVEDGKSLKLSLEQMSSPTFEDTITNIICRTQPQLEEKDYQRPLSSILDIRDEVFDKLITIFTKKPVWALKDLYTHPLLNKYTKNVLDYLIQNAIESQFKISDKEGRAGKLQSRDGIITLAFNEHDTLVEKLVNIEKGKNVSLPAAAIVEDDKETKLVDLAAKREAFEWPVFATDNFENDVLEWYLLDNEVTPQEKTKYLLNLDWNDPPVYAENLITKMKDGSNMYILGLGKIYNNDKQVIVPIGEELDTYTKWLEEAKNRFIENKDKIFATSKDNRVYFNIDDKDTEIKKAARSKRIEPRACSNFTDTILNAFAEWLSGSPFPETVKTKPDKCMYLNLLIRRAVIHKKEGIYWLSNEEFEILNDHEPRKDILNRLK